MYVNFVAKKLYNFIFYSPAPLSVPTITQHPTDIIAVPGQSAILSCSFSGEPPPSVAWSQDNVTLTPSSQVKFIMSYIISTLYAVIHMIHIKVSVVYSCIQK